MSTLITNEPLTGMTPDSLLKHVTIFENCSEDFVTIVQEQVTTKWFEEGSEIICQGDIGDAMYILHRGEVEVLTNSEAVATLSEGAVFGEMALLSKNPVSAKRTETILAKTNCVCRRVDRDQLHQTLARFPADKAIIEGLAQSRLESLRKNGLLPRKNGLKRDWWRPAEGCQEDEQDLSKGAQMWRKLRRNSCRTLLERIKVSADETGKEETSTTPARARRHTTTGIEDGTGDRWALLACSAPVSCGAPSCEAVTEGIFKPDVETGSPRQHNSLAKHNQPAGRDHIPSKHNALGGDISCGGCCLPDVSTGEAPAWSSQGEVASLVNSPQFVPTTSMIEAALAFHSEGLSPTVVQASPSSRLRTTPASGGKSKKVQVSHEAIVSPTARRSTAAGAGGGRRDWQRPRYDSERSTDSQDFCDTPPRYYSHHSR
jgi:hypothetical protein